MSSEVMNLNILERIRLDNSIEQKNEMAKRLSISKSLYSMIINGQLPISKRVAIEVHNQFGVSLESLLCPQVQQVATTGTDGN
jgi:plasmid maintenance system antidote protein VapI